MTLPEGQLKSLICRKLHPAVGGFAVSGWSLKWLPLRLEYRNRLVQAGWWEHRRGECGEESYGNGALAFSGR